jgi:hypothetical protein
MPVLIQAARNQKSPSRIGADRYSLITITTSRYSIPEIPGDVIRPAPVGSHTIELKITPVGLVAPSAQEKQRVARFKDLNTKQLVQMTRFLDGRVAIDFWFFLSDSVVEMPGTKGSSLTGLSLKQILSVRCEASASELGI